MLERSAVGLGVLGGAGESRITNQLIDLWEAVGSAGRDRRIPEDVARLLGKVVRTVKELLNRHQLDIKLLYGGA